MDVADEDSGDAYGAAEQRPLMDWDEPIPHPWLTPRAVALMMAAMWIASLALPVWELRSESAEFGVAPGALPAITGPFGLLMWCPAWLANLMLFGVCRVMLKGRLVPFWVVFLTMAVALTAYVAPATYGSNERADIVGHQIGYYVWLGSFWVALVSHAMMAGAEFWPPVKVRWALIAALLVAIMGLEYRFDQRRSPFERVLRSPDDLSAFTEVIAANPPQAQKDWALRWVINQSMEKPDNVTRFARVEQLVAAGGNVNQKYHGGDTPLIDLVRRKGSERLVQLLIRSGADVNARRYESTVLDTAMWFEASRETRQMLIDAGAKTKDELARDAATTVPTK